MRRSRILIADSSNAADPTFQRWISSYDVEVRWSQSWEGVERMLAALPPASPRFVFLDGTLCSGQGFEPFLHRAQSVSPETVFIVFHRRGGAAIEHLLRADRLDDVRPATEADGDFLIVRESAVLRELLKLADRFAISDLTVLITGETGVGKEVLARYVHAHSRRSARPFVACNLAALPRTLVESELFGAVKGAFTGADHARKGYVEAAEGGTLFLDEVGDVPGEIQLKLLRFLESREFYRVGESTPRTANVRIIAATNADLEHSLSHGFRQDLYYRLNGARIFVPPLRERQEEILPLAEEFLQQVARRNGTARKGLTATAQSLLTEYTWQGNVRELRNVIESAAVVADGDRVTAADLPPHIQSFGTHHRRTIGLQSLRRIDEAERRILHQALRESGGARSEAARALGISVRTLYRKLEKFPDCRETGKDAGSLAEGRPLDTALPSR